jgi:hypothetical protein
VSARRVDGERKGTIAVCLIGKLEPVDDERIIDAPGAHSGSYRAFSLAYKRFTLSLVNPPFTRLKLCLIKADSLDLLLGVPAMLEWIRAATSTSPRKTVRRVGIHLAPCRSRDSICR